MNPFQPPHRFWLSGTRAFEVEPGETVQVMRTSERCLMPFRTATGRYIVADLSTENELIRLDNAARGHGNDSMNAAALPEWPWTPVLDDMPARTGHRWSEFTLPDQEAIKAGADAR